MNERVRERLVKEFLDYRNWKINFAVVSRKSGVSVVTVRKFFGEIRHKLVVDVNLLLDYDSKIC